MHMDENELISGLTVQTRNFARVFHLFKISNYDMLTLRSEILFLEFSSREKKKLNYLNLSYNLYVEYIINKLLLNNHKKYIYIYKRALIIQNIMNNQHVC